MKSYYIILIFVLLIYSACKIQSKALYQLPEEMLPHVKVVYEQECIKGQALYLITCNNCHNKGSKRKVIIPDWSAEQLSGYTLRISNKRHEENMPDSLVSEEELGTIMTFLSYKKKNK
jgi:hypothetical protein